MHLHDMTSNNSTSMCKYVCTQLFKNTGVNNYSRTSIIQMFHYLQWIFAHTKIVHMVALLKQSRKHAVLNKSYFNSIREYQILQQIESFKCIVLMIDKS